MRDWNNNAWEVVQRPFHPLDGPSSLKQYGLWPREQTGELDRLANSNKDWIGSDQNSHFLFSHILTMRRSLFGWMDKRPWSRLLATPNLLKTHTHTHTNYYFFLLIHFGTISKCADLRLAKTQSVSPFGFKFFETEQIALWEKNKAKAWYQNISWYKKDNFCWSTKLIACFDCKYFYPRVLMVSEKRTSSKYRVTGT